MPNIAVIDQADMIMAEQSDCGRSAALKENGNTLYRQGKILEGTPETHINLATLQSNR